MKELGQLEIRGLIGVSVDGTQAMAKVVVCLPGHEPQSVPIVKLPGSVLEVEGVRAACEKLVEEVGNFFQKQFEEQMDAAGISYTPAVKKNHMSAPCDDNGNIYPTH